MAKTITSFLLALSDSREIAQNQDTETPTPTQGPGLEKSGISKARRSAVRSGGATEDDFRDRVVAEGLVWSRSEQVE